MKRLVSGFYGARSIASTMLVLGLVSGFLVTPQATALEQTTSRQTGQSTTGQSTTRTGASSAASANTVSTQVANQVARSVSNVLLRDVVAATMGLFNTKTPAGFATRLESKTNPTAADISTETSVDSESKSYLPGDTVTITVTVKATGSEAKNVKVFVLLPQASEGFIATKQTGAPICTPAGGAQCPDTPWNYDALISSLDVTATSIPANGSLEFKITGVAGVQKTSQNGNGIIAMAGNGVNAFSSASFSVKKENVSVTALFDLTGSEPWIGSVGFTGMLKCTVPGGS
ncbi:hypothetical protein KJY77_05950, partial [Canibacter sp. lx-72]|uniref:hypothetical protein n=1 Tax=Canibacter zhuwentaonis TaxID=2837491 RepID=UPI001BDD4270